MFSKGTKCATDTAYGGNVPKFSRLNVWDPYKRLGISRDASEEEIWSSRNFLLNQYANHERSAESIEAAFEKILMKSFINRKKTKINLKTRLKKASRGISTMGSEPPQLCGTSTTCNYHEEIIPLWIHGMLECDELC